MFQVSQFKTRLSLGFFWLGCGEPPAQNGPWSGGSVFFATSKQSSPSYNLINFLHLLAVGITAISTNLISWHVCFVNWAWNPQNWGLEEFFLLFPMNIHEFLEVLDSMYGRFFLFSAWGCHKTDPMMPQDDSTVLPSAGRWNRVVQWRPVTRCCLNINHAPSPRKTAVYMTIVNSIILYWFRVDSRDICRIQTQKNNTGSL